MIDCLIIGDSIAYGVSTIRTECVAYVKSGISSRDWFSNNISKAPFAAKTVIISLGSNDLKNINTEAELISIRSNTKADCVYWILPAIKPNVQEIVYRVAKQNSDNVIVIDGLSSDKVHPTTTGYRLLATKTK